MARKTTPGRAGVMMRAAVRAPRQLKRETARRVGEVKASLVREARRPTSRHTGRSAHRPGMVVRTADPLVMAPPSDAAVADRVITVLAPDAAIGDRLIAVPAPDAAVAGGTPGVPSAGLPLDPAVVEEPAPGGQATRLE